MKHPVRQGFTLIELLVVISIIGVLAGVALPVFSNIQLAGKRTQSLSNVRQIGAAILNYCGDNNGQLPTAGVPAPTWAANTAAEANAWYNILGGQKNYGNTKGLADFVNNTADFYKKGSLFYVPTAKYPANKLTAPLFAVAFCSRIFGDTGTGKVDTEIIDPNSVRMSNFQSPAETCLLQEVGLPGETKINSNQAAYTGQAQGYAPASITRYTGKTVMVFADGHADTLFGKDMVDPGTGKAYNPQMSAPGTTTPGGKVYWTMNTSLNAN